MQRQEIKVRAHNKKHKPKHTTKIKYIEGMVQFRYCKAFSRYIYWEFTNQSFHERYNRYIKLTFKRRIR